MENIRIQRLLADAGVASRRGVEQMILEGRITVNGELVAALPCFVRPSDEILVDGQPIPKRPERHLYILLNKPRGVVCTQRDDPRYNRPRATDLIPPLPQRVYCVGRLDEDSTGLIILTNDGELTNRLTHPRYGVTRTYLVRVAGRFGPQQAQALRRGMFPDDQRTSSARLKVLRQSHQESLLEIGIREGRNRQVRRMLARMGHNVRRLHRRAIGPIQDRGLKIGHFRYLSASEVALLRKATGVP